MFRIFAIVFALLAGCLSTNAADVGSGARVVGLIATGIPGIEQWGLSMKAASVTMRNPVDGSTVTVKAPSGVQAWMSAAAPPFSNLYVYFLYSSTNGISPCPSGAACYAGTEIVTGVVSTSPPDVGPILPVGVTHYAYAYSIRSDGSGGMYPSVHAAGNKVFFQGFIFQTVYNWVAPSGAPVNQNNIQIWHWVPDDALDSTTWWDAEVLTSGTVNINFVVLFQAPFSFQITGAQRVAQNLTITTPTNSGMYVPVQFYSGSYAGVSELFLGFQILSYTVANGG